MVSDDFTDQDLIAELLQLRPTYPPRHGGVTAREWAKARGIGKRYAYTQLEEWVSAGILRVEWNSIPGEQAAKVYYRVG